METLDDFDRAAKRWYLTELLNLHGYNVSKAAQAAGRNRTEFYRVLAKYGVAPRINKTPRRVSRIPSSDFARFLGASHGLR